MSSVLICDADVFITLAQHPANQGATTAITNSVFGSDGELELVVPVCVSAAYDREKAEAAKRFWGTLRTAIKNFRNLASPLSEPTRIGELADELNNRIDKLQSSVPETVEKVDQLISLGRLVSHNDAVWAEAARRFRDGNPPGQRSQKSSITDCILWSVVLNEAKRNAVIFCTNNKADFSDPKHGAKLHPDLVEELGDAKYCYHSLESFISNHLKTKPAVVTDYSIRCLYCGSFTEPGLIERPSAYGGWSAQRFCGQCHRYTDLGDLSDE